MHRGVAQVWAVNRTNTVLDHMSMLSMLKGLLACIKRSFGDLD